MLWPTNWAMFCGIVAAVAEEIRYVLDDVADQNLRKLQSRQERGVLKGSGDNR